MGPAKEISGHRKGVSDSHNNTMPFLFSEFDTQWLIHQELVMGPQSVGSRGWCVLRGRYVDYTQLTAVSTPGCVTVGSKGPVRAPS
jgi:hypothetical protein